MAHVALATSPAISAMMAWIKGDEQKESGWRKSKVCVSSQLTDFGTWRIAWTRSHCQIGEWSARYASGLNLREALEARASKCMFGGGHLERYVCPGCGCIYGPSKYLDLPAELVAADYALLYADYDEGDSTVNELRAFRSLNPSSGRLYLNWGCGRWSRAVEIARTEGFDVWGYEPVVSPAERSFIVSRKEVITTGFAGIFSNNVIEHLLRPVDEFRYFHRIMAPGGLMAHASPCYQDRYEFSRFHVVFLLGDAPHVLAERSGFRVIHFEEDGEFRNCVFERI